MHGRSSAGERRKRVDTRRVQVTLESGMALLLQELPCITRLRGTPKSTKVRGVRGCEGGVRGGVHSAVVGM